MAVVLAPSYEPVTIAVHVKSPRFVGSGLTLLSALVKKQARAALTEFINSTTKPLISGAAGVEQRSLFFVVGKGIRLM